MTLPTFTSGRRLADRFPGERRRGSVPPVRSPDGEHPGGAREKEGALVTRRARAYLTAAALVLSCAACGHHGPAAPASPAPSASPQPASHGRIVILRPANGQVIRTPTLHVKVRITAASPGETVAPQALPGWLHLYVDGKIVSIQPVPGRNSMMDHAIPLLRPGRHLLRAEFVQPNHLPWRPSVATTVTFTVRGP